MVSALISKFPRLVFTVVLLAVVSACDNEGNTGNLAQTALLNQLGLTQIEIRARDTVTLNPATLDPTGEIYLAINDTEQLLAIGIDANGTEYPISNDVTWRSADPAIASVNATGLLTAGATATTVDITVTLSTLSGTQTINVSDASPTSLTIVDPAPVDVCKSVPLEANATFSDSMRRFTHKVDWTVSGTADQARIGNGDGDKGILGISVLTTAFTVSATYLSLSDTQPVTAVNTNDALSDIVLSPATETTVVAGETLQFIATGTYASGSHDISTNATWSSSDPAKATIDASGLLSGLADGPTNISAACGGFTSVATAVNVSGNAALIAVKIELQPDYLELNTTTNITKQLDVRAYYADGSSEVVTLDENTTWRVSIIPDRGDPITVSNTAGTTTGDKGLVTAGSVGDAQVFVNHHNKEDKILVVVR